MSVRAALASRQLGHVFAPVWHAESGALYGFEASPRFLDGTSPAEAFAIARETGDVAALGELSLLSALRASWNLPGMLLLRVDPTEDFAFELPSDTVLRPSGAIVAELPISAHVQAAALRHTAAVLRGQGLSLALSGHDSQALSRAFEDVGPDIVKVGPQQWSQGGEDVLGLIGIAHGAKALALCSGIDRPGQIGPLAELGCDLVEGRHVGRPAPVDAWTPARIGLSWPSEASR